jgi:HK97 gp10 family phage protein
MDVKINHRIIQEEVEKLTEAINEEFATEFTSKIKENIVNQGLVKTGLMRDTAEVIPDPTGEKNLIIGTEYQKFQEYGTATIPPHGFIRQAFENISSRFVNREIAAIKSNYSKDTNAI